MLNELLKVLNEGVLGPGEELIKVKIEIIF